MERVTPMERITPGICEQHRWLCKQKCDCLITDMTAAIASFHLRGLYFMHRDGMDNLKRRTRHEEAEEDADDVECRTAKQFAL